jgi:hypothetical protein
VGLSAAAHNAKFNAATSKASSNAAKKAAVARRGRASMASGWVKGFPDQTTMVQNAQD